MAGLLDVKIVKGTSNGDTFYDFVQENLFPHVMRFNGVNPHSVVVLDNCAIHHVAELTSMLGSRSDGPLFTTISPDFNPIEEAFAKVKANIESLRESSSDMETQLLTSFLTITPAVDGFHTVVCCSYNFNSVTIV